MTNTEILFRDRLDNNHTRPHVSIIKKYRHKIVGIGIIYFSERFKTLSVNIMNEFELTHEEWNTIHEKLNELEETRK